MILKASKIYPLMFSIASKDKLRESLTGVYHKEGKLIATDASVLVCAEFNYSPEFEGKLIAKNGKEIEAAFPEYEAVIPDHKDMHLARYLSEPDLFEACSNLPPKPPVESDKIINLLALGDPLVLSPVHVNPSHLLRVLNVFRRYNEIPELYLGHPHRAIKLISPSVLAIVMPCVVVDDSACITK